MLEEFADKRGLPVPMVEKFVRIAKSEEPYPGWLAFDYPNKQGIWTTRYRNPDPASNHRWRSTPGDKTHLYNPLLIGPNTKEVWFCEGETDTLTLVSLGLDAVGLPGVDQWKPISKALISLFEEAFVVVAFDNDETGQEAAARLEARFAPRAATLVPPDGMDINEWFVNDPDDLYSSIADLRAGVGLG